MSNGEDSDLGIDVLQRFVKWLDDVALQFIFDKLGDPGAKSALMEMMGLDPALGNALPNPNVPQGMRERVPL